MSIVTLYNAEETDFLHNGLGILSATSAEVTEVLNGMFELKLVCPALDSQRQAITDKRTWEKIKNDMLIKAFTPRGFQLFRIYRVGKKIEGAVTVNARHIFYDGLYNNTSIGGIMSAGTALRALYTNASHKTRFVAESTITGSAAVEITDVNIAAAIMGSGGIIETFGGEILRDNFNVTLMPTIGADRGFKARYRKNLTGLDIEENAESVVTRIKPVAQSRENKPLYLPEIYVDSPNISNYFMPKIAVVKFSELRVGDDGMTEEAIFAEMRARARGMLSGGADLPTVNAKVDFILLSQTVNFAEYAPLEDIHLGDVVSVIHNGLNVNFKSKCIKYTYDCMRSKYNRVELGELRPDFGGVITKRAAGTAAVTDTLLSAHIGDMDAHLTAEEKAWIEEHRNDEVSHLTPEEKEWIKKQMGAVI